MVFAVITFADGLSDAERQRAAAGAPPCTDSPAPYGELLKRSDWEIVQRVDATATFARISRGELAAFEVRAERLRALLGDDEFTDRLALRRSKVAGIRDGLIRRELFVTRPRPHQGSDRPAQHRDNTDSAG